MYQFQLHNTVDFHFGPGAAEDLPKILEGRAKKVMLLLGGGSAKRNGAYDDFHRILEGAGIGVVDFGGVTAPDNKFMLAGIEKAKEEAVDCVIGIGGSCCMDFAKLVAFGAKNDGIWDWLSFERPYEGTEEHLIIGCVPTFPGGGSEGDPYGEVDDFERNVHGTLVGPLPDFAIMDPTYTYTLDTKQTATAAMMGFCQIATNMLAAPDTFTNALGYGAMRAIVEGLAEVAEDPEDYDARAKLMLSPLMSTFGLLTIQDQANWGGRIYDFMAGLRLAEGQPYRVAFPVILPHFIKAESKYHGADAKRFFVNVFGVDEELPEEEAVEKGLAAMEQMYRDNELPWRFEEVADPVSDEKIRELAEAALPHLDLTLEEAVTMMTDCVKAV